MAKLRLDGMAFSTSRPNNWPLTATKELRIHAMWPGASTYPDDYLALPNQADVETAIDALSLQPGDYLWHDIEHWNSSTPADLVKLETVYQWIYDYAKSVEPTVNVGCYGYPFKWNRSSALSTYGSTAHTDWVNSQATSLVEFVDILMPHLYCFGTNQADYLAYAKESLRVSRAIAGPGKKVIAFLWWVYHEGASEYGSGAVSVSGVSNASPAVVTTADEVPTNNLAAGDEVWFAGGWSDANYNQQYFKVANPSLTTLELNDLSNDPVDSSAFGTYAPTGNESIKVLVDPDLMLAALQNSDDNADGFILWGGGLSQPWIDGLSWYNKLQEYLA